MSSNERLGIEIVVDKVRTSGTLETEITAAVQTIGKKIENGMGPLDLSKMLSGSVAQITQAFQGIANSINGAFKFDTLNAGIDSLSGKLKLMGDGLTGLTSKLKKDLSETAAVINKFSFDNKSLELKVNTNSIAQAAQQLEALKAAGAAAEKQLDVYKNNINPFRHAPDLKTLYEKNHSKMYEGVDPADFQKVMRKYTKFDLGQIYGQIMSVSGHGSGHSSSADSLTKPEIINVLQRQLPLLEQLRTKWSAYKDNLRAISYELSIGHQIDSLNRYLNETANISPKNLQLFSVEIKNIASQLQQLTGLPTNKITELLAPFSSATSGRYSTIKNAINSIDGYSGLSRDEKRFKLQEMGLGTVTQTVPPSVAPQVTQFSELSSIMKQLIEAVNKLPAANQAASASITNTGAVAAETAKIMKDLNAQLDLQNSSKADRKSAVAEMYKAIAKAVGLTAEEVKRLDEQFKLNEKTASMVKGIGKYGEGKDTHLTVKEDMEVQASYLTRQKQLQQDLSEEKRRQAEINKAYKQAEKDGDKQALVSAQTNAMYAAQRRSEIERTLKLNAQQVADEKERLKVENDLAATIAKRTAEEVRGYESTKGLLKERIADTKKLEEENIKFQIASKTAELALVNAAKVSGKSGVDYNNLDSAVARTQNALGGNDLGELKAAIALLQKEKQLIAAMLPKESSQKLVNVDLEAIKKAGQALHEIALASRGAGVSLMQVEQALKNAGISLHDFIKDKDKFTDLNRMLKEFGHTVDRNTAGLKEMKKTNVFSFLGESLGTLTTRLAEFYSVRNILFSVGSTVRESVGSVLDFNQALHDMAAISGASVEGMRKFEESAIKIATASRFTTAEVTQMMEMLAQAGVKENEIPDVAKATSLFATGAKANAEQSTKLMTTSMNVYEIGASESMRITNALTAALNSSKLEAGGLSTAFNYLANQAKAMNISFEGTLGIIAAMSQKGLRDSTIGTGASNVLAQLSAPKPKFQALLSSKGIAAEEINPTIVGFEAAIDRLQKAGFTTSELMSALERQAGRSLVTMLNVGVEGFREFREAVTGTDAALIANYKAMDGTRAKMNVLKQELVASANDISKAFEGVASTGMKIARSFATGMGTDEGQKGIVAGGAVIALVGTLSLAARLVTTWKEVTSAIVAAEKAVTFFSVTTQLLTKTNWVMLALSTAVLGAGAAVAYFGNKQRETKEENEAFVKTIAKQSEKYQQGQMSLLEFKHSLDKTQISKSGLIKMTDAQINQLEQLKNKYPDIIGHLDTENLKIQDINKSLDEYNNKRNALTSSSRQQYNYAGTQIMNTETSMRNNPVYKTLKDMLKEANYPDTGDTAENIKLLEANSKYKDRAASMRGYFSKELSGIEGQKRFQELYKPAVGATRPVVSGSGAIVDMSFETVEATEKPAKPSAKPDKKDQATADMLGLKIDKLKLEIADWKKKLTDIHTDSGDLIPLRDGILSNVEEIRKLENIKAAEESKKYKTGGDAVLDVAKKTNQQRADNEVDSTKEMYRHRIEAITNGSKTLGDALEKAKDSEAKRMADLEIKVLEKEIASAYTNNERRKVAIQEVMKAYTVSVNASVDKELVELEKSWDAFMKTGPSDDELFSKAEEFGRVATLIESSRPKRLKEEGTKVQTLGETGSKASSDRLLKEEESRLDTELKLVDLLTKEAVGAENLYALKKKALQVEEDSLTKQRGMVEAYLYDLPQGAADYNERVEEAVTKLGVIEQRLKNIQKETKDAGRSWSAEFIAGMEQSYNKFTDWKATLNQAGSNVADTAFNGLTNSISGAMTASNAFGTQDKTQIAEMRNSIRKLEDEKNKLEAEVSNAEQYQASNLQDQSAQVAGLSEKKLRLEEVNSQLDQQKQKLAESTNAWKAFAAGMADVAKAVVKAIQEMIVKMIAMKIVSSAMSLFGGTIDPTTADMEGGANFMGPLQKADGGMIPLTSGIRGKDSVPIMGMPGEYMVKTSAVDYYGIEFMDAVNNKTLKKFADGGLVGSSSRSSSATGSSTQPVQLNIYNFADPSSVPTPKPEDIINIISFDASRRGTTHKVMTEIARGNL